MADKDSTSFDTMGNTESASGPVPGIIDNRVFLDDLLNEPELAAHMNLINEEMDRFLDSFKGEPGTLYDAAKYLVRAGGKRFRSLITLLSCEAVGGDPRDSAPFAIAVELVQTASLIHDDIIDEDVLRRGVETTHQKYGSAIAVLAGDLLVAQAVRLIGDMANKDLLKMVAQGGVLLCEGEVSDMLMGEADPGRLSVSEYLEMIKRKTAVLMRVSAGIGALIGGGSEEEREALMNYAEGIGMAFQIRDDLLNLTSSQKVTGKSMFSDLEWERSNIVLIHCLETATDPLKKQIIEDIENENFGVVIRAMEVHGSFDYANDLARQYAERAKEYIRPMDFPIEPILDRLADFVVTRVH